MRISDWSSDVCSSDLIVSTQIDVAFEITDSPIEELKGAYAVIWTTTPWTIPVNQALAYGPEVEYALVTLDVNAKGVDGQDGTLIHELLKANPSLDLLADPRVLIAKPLLEAFGKRLDAALAKASDRKSTRLNSSH